MWYVYVNFIYLEEWMSKIVLDGICPSETEAVFLHSSRKIFPSIDLWSPIKNVCIPIRIKVYILYMYAAAGHPVHSSFIQLYLKN